MEDLVSITTIKHFFGKVEHLLKFYIFFTLEEINTNFRNSQIFRKKNLMHLLKLDPTYLRLIY